jgi:flap endonuclease-1
VNVTPEMLELSENLARLGIGREQLIAIGMLCGTDFNIGGVKGIGPKKALLLAKKHGSNFGSLFDEAKWAEHFSTPWQEIFALFSDMPVADDYILKWGGIDMEKVLRLMVEDHEFSRERIEKALEPLSKNSAQKGLSDFF